MNKRLKELRSFIAYRVQEGFESEEEIVENAVGFAQETLGDKDCQREVEQLTAELLAAHRAEQANWESPTDCDRLDKAFSALNRRHRCPPGLQLLHPLRAYRHLGRDCRAGEEASR